MSRRITFFVLATSAALIATQATADPECFGDTCHLREVVEPAQAPEPDEPAALETSASVQNPAPVKALPEVVTPYVTRQEARQEARPETRPVEAPKPVAAPQVAAAPGAADPVVRQPVLPKQSVADEASTPRKPAKVAHAAAPRQAAAAREPVPVIEVATPGYARSARVLSSEPAYTVTPAAAMTGTAVVVVPGSAYAGYRGAPGYLIAPGAKIISIDSDD